MLAAYTCGAAWRGRVRKYIESQVLYLEAFIEKEVPELTVVRPQASFLARPLDSSGAHTWMGA